jgi:hypothetical protein
MVKRKTIVCELKEFPEPATGVDWDNCNTVGRYALLLNEAGVEEAKGQLGIQLSRRAGNWLTAEVQQLRSSGPPIILASVPLLNRLSRRIRRTI